MALAKGKPWPSASPRRRLALLVLALLVLLLHAAGPAPAAGGVAGDDDGHVGDWKRWQVGREARLEMGFRAAFQRVDGIVFGLEQTLKGPGARPPRLKLAEAYAFHRERWLYEAAIEVPLPAPGPPVASAGFFRLTRPFAGLDGRIITDVENTLGALLFKVDYRDYYEEAGFAAHLRQPLGRHSAIEAGYSRSEHKALANSTRTSLIRWEEDFRPNPAAAAGHQRAVRLEASRDTRRERRGHPGTAHWYRVQWERAGGGLGGDFDYSQLTADLRQYVKLSPGQALSARILYGTNRSGRLPAQKRFALGGVGTLRGHDFKALAGEQCLLGNIEYRFEVMRKLYSLVFVDVGATAEDEGELADQRFALDGGLGLGTRNGRAEMTLARDLRAADAPFRVGFRLGAMF